MTLEPPTGLRSNLLRTYNAIDDRDLIDCSKPNEYKKLLFGFALFHAIVQDRRKFGPIGWNIAYEFTNEDLSVCRRQLKLFLEEYDQIPYKVLNYLGAEINYGGRVTDDKDVRLITCLLSKYFNPDVMDDSYKFSSSGVYLAPPEGEIEETKKFITEFPLEDDPDVFGLHPNADITYQQKTVREFMLTLLHMNPKSSDKSAGGLTNDEIVAALAAEIEAKLKEVFGNGVKLIDKVVISIDVFRAQETVRFNKLVRLILKSLADLQKAIKGLVVMSISLEKIYNSFLNKKVPGQWADNAYPSLKPLGSWVDDLIARLKFMHEWSVLPENQNMNSYWVPAFFFPQGK